jgi:hypothetical protein
MNFADLQNEFRNGFHGKPLACGFPQTSRIDTSHVQAGFQGGRHCFPDAGQALTVHTFLGIAKIGICTGNLEILQPRSHTYNKINQSPVVDPVDACVKCSKLASESSFTIGSGFSVNFCKIASSLAGPSYKRGTP